MAAISQGWLVKGEAKEKNLFLKLFETVFSVVMNICLYFLSSAFDKSFSHIGVCGCESCKQCTGVRFKCLKIFVPVCLTAMCGCALAQ